MDTLDDLLRSQSGRAPHRIALIGDGRSVGYGELDRAVECLANRFDGIGITGGDRAVVHLPNSIEFILVICALFRLGAVPALALPAHRRSEIGQMCRTTAAVAYIGPRSCPGFDPVAMAEEVRAANPALRHLLFADRDKGLAEDAFLLCDGVRLSDRVPGQGPLRDRPSPAAGDLALLLLSGGTTGSPKPIPRTHRDYLYNVRESAAVCRFDENTVYLAALPTAHNFALGCPGILGTLAAGGTVVTAPDPAPETAFPLIERHRVTVTALTPTLLALWLTEAGWSSPDLSSLDLVQVGGARLSEAMAARVAPELGCGLQQVFGMAEGLLCYTRPDEGDDLTLTTQGRPLSPLDELRVVGDDGREVAAGATGHLQVRGPYTVRGYYRAPEADAVAFTPDGFFRTGDLVRLTPGGHVVVTGRSADVVNRGGEKVAAAEVEDHLCAHPSVAGAAVVGMPDRLLGERTCAFVVPRPLPAGREPVEPPALAELSAFLRDRGLAAYKVPDRLEIVGALPRTAAGKTDKRRLAALLRDRTAPSPGPRGRGDETVRPAIVKETP